MSDIVTTTPEEDAGFLNLFASAHYIEDDGEMHPVEYDGDADEDAEGDDSPPGDMEKGEEAVDDESRVE